MDSVFYTLGESTASVDVLSSATVQKARETDVYDHSSSKEIKTTSLITFPIEGYSRLAFWVVSSTKLSTNSVELYPSEYTYLNSLSSQKSTKTVLVGTSPTFVSIDLTSFSTNTLTLKLTLQGSEHFYMYSLFLE